MKAAIRTQYGPPEVLDVREVPKPTPKDNELLIRVHATTVNRTDCGVLWGAPFVFRFFTGLTRPRHATTGTDFAGRVEAVGARVTAFKPGDRVFGFDDNGLPSHAEYMTLAEDRPVALIPAGRSYPEAAASIEGAHYAYNYARAIQKRGAKQVLVYGATGAIGSAAVQILKAAGLYVTAVCNTKNMETVRALGPDKVVDYEREDFTQDSERYDAVLDAVGKSEFGVCKKLLRESGGVYMSSELGPRAENVYLPLLSPFMGPKKVAFPIPVDIKGSLRHICSLIEAGKFRPLIDRTYPLEQIREAFAYVHSGQKTGNVILEMAAEE
ncbi:MAG: NAD(P)-dependent alcohol dehydrogenase [Saprospiraceae bacterium]|nr:NAD(P)-dependent alcohol dehydrogenase [Saprospiraceae bacterium]